MKRLIQPASVSPQKNCSMEEEIGHVREKELYEVLLKRFGKDCVYLNSKYRRPDGAEKELWDVFVLALPYAIVFQMKWRDRTAQDFSGEHAEVEINRLRKRMNAAAKQFREFLSLYENHATIMLPRVWRHQAEFYELPLDSIEQILPVVVVDFDDPDYAHPEQRTCLGPQVTEVPNCVKPFGAVHSFLFKDLVRIIEEMFTIGDLVTYLSKRRMMLESGVGFLQYSEMDMFSLYQTDYPLWEKLLDKSAVVIEPGVFEATIAKHNEMFIQRQQYFTAPDFVDGLIDQVIHSDANDMACLHSLGRLRLLTSVMKKDVSDVLSKNMCSISSPANAQICRMRNSIGNYASVVMPRTYFCVIVFTGTSDKMLAVADYGYLRTLSRIKEEQKERVAKEVVIIIVSAIVPTSHVEIRPIGDTDYEHALTQEEVESSRFEYSERQFTASDWKYMQENRTSNHTKPKRGFSGTSPL